MNIYLPVLSFTKLHFHRKKKNGRSKNVQEKCPRLRASSASEFVPLHKTIFSLAPFLKQKFMAFFIARFMQQKKRETLILMKTVLKLLMIQTNLTKNYIVKQ